MSFRPPAFNRRGVALPLALFTLVIAAVMITAVFWVARQEQRMGYNSVASTQAFEAAEAGIASVLSGWTPYLYNSIASGTTVSLPSASLGGSSVYTASLRRLNTTLFLIRAEGRYLVAGQAVTRRQVARVIRLDPPVINPSAALVTRLGLDVRDDATVSGRDSVAPTWGPVCPPPGPMAAAILDSAAAITTSGPCAAEACLNGAPNIQTDPAAAATTVYRDFGITATFDELASAAEKIAIGSVGTLDPVIDPGPTCRISNSLNWGDPWDPTGPCGEYLPVIYAPGDLTLSSGRGQGLLLVQGDFTLTGSAEFYGVIIVRGAITTTGGHVVGALMTENQLGGSASVGGTTTLGFSRCAISRAVAGAAQPSALRDRSWVQLY